MRYKVHSLDVWGNVRDGFNVNDVYPSHAEIDLPAEPTDAQVIRALVDAGSLKSARFQFDVEGEIGHYMWVGHAPTGRPLLELRPVN